MSSQKQTLGRLGEELAEKFLKDKGYLILNRNWRCKFGELDIVAAKTSGILGRLKNIIFVEVKTIDQVEAQFEAQAEQKVNYFKQKHLIKSAQDYLRTNKIKPDIPWQIDVIGIEYDQIAGAHKIRHWEKAVWI